MDAKTPNAVALDLPMEETRVAVWLDTVSSLASRADPLEPLLSLMPTASPADIRAMRRPRAEIRMLCADMVQVCWKEPTGRKCKSTALLEDISSLGMCLQFEIPLSIGTHVDVHCPGNKLTGIVRYCVYREIGYFVGIELDSASRWSRQQFEPQHLLDLEDLVLRSAGRASGTIQ